MSVMESLFVCVRDRVAELDCSMPDSVAIMPDNFCTTASRQDLRVRAEGIALRNLLEKTEVPVESFFLTGEHIIRGQDGGLDWESSLFISSDLLSRNPNAVPAMLATLSNYLNGSFKGHPNKQISLVLVVERNSDKSCRKLTYDGGIAGLSGLAEHVRRVVHG
jgi:hypothetical protein